MKLNTGMGIMQVQQHCSKCGGKGKIQKNDCPVCRGNKVVRSKNEIQVHVPKGTKNGECIRLNGKGD
jgi:molecular chaperone DnaJ